MRTLLFFAYFIIGFTSIFAQQVTITGLVTDNDGVPLDNVSVFIKGSQNATYTDSNGKYTLVVAEVGSTISCSVVGFLQQEKQISGNSDNMVIDFVLKQDPAFALDDVVIVGKSTVRQIEETGFNAIAIDATPFHNATVGMTEILERAPGVKIQEEGGLGSRANVTINGLSGRHVRFFIDGMPMDAMSSSFQINNLPVNLAERIEVYKGVVPVNFGSDALGGAVNIVTKKTTWHLCRCFLFIWQL